MLAHNIKISVFFKPEEDFDSAIASFKALLPFDLENEKIAISVKNAESFQERVIKIISVFLDKQKHVRKFMDWLKSQVSETQRDMLLQQKESRLDDEIFFYLRVDKKQWIDEKKISITDSGDCYHVKIHIAAFPKTKKNALKVVEEWLG